MKALLKAIIPKKVENSGRRVLNYFAQKIFQLKYKPLIIRKGTTDRDVFWSIFVLNEFKLPIKINPKLIVDAGAYSGLSTLYYASKYPSAKIIAIEPEKSNFSLLEEQTKNLPNVQRINAGLWSKNAFLKILNPDVDKWAFRITEVDETSNYDVKAITINEVLKQSGFDKIDILKLDIEGSEKELFTNNYDSWINKVNIIVIELHDRIIEGCTESLYNAIDITQWDEYITGEKVLLIRKELIKSTQ